MTLATLCLLLGAVTVVAHLPALLQPTAVTSWLHRFPRSVPWGVVLMLGGTAWFEWNLWQEQLMDIAPWKTLMLVGFGLVGVGCCLFVKDYLAVRGLAVVLMMTAWWVCELARWHPHPLSKVLTAWAYVWVFFAFWWSMSPWRLRDAIDWVTASSTRLRIAAAGGVVWGAFIVGLGLTVLR